MSVFFLLCVSCCFRCMTSSVVLVPLNMAKVSYAWVGGHATEDVSSEEEAGGAIVLFFPAVFHVLFDSVLF